MKDILFAIFATILSILVVVLGIAWKVAIPVFIVFLALKLIGIITFGWFWVLFPLIVMAVSFILLVFINIILEEI